MKYKEIVCKCSKLMLFTIITFFFFIQMTYIFRGTLAHTRNNICGFYAEEKNSLDVVIIGTSSTFSAIMPMELWGNYGIAAYNMCTNVLFEDAIRFHVREMKKTQNPQLLIIDTAPFLYGHKSSIFADVDSHLRYNTDGLSISRNRIDLINTVIPRGDRLEYYLDLFYYHNNPSISIKYLFNKCPNERKGYNNLGQSVCYDEADYIMDLNELELPEEDNGYFIDLLEELKTFNGNILFIEQPVFYTHENIEQCRYSEYIEKKVKEYGYEYLDLSKVREDIGVESQFDYSLDYLHFNIFSAEKITDYLAKYITGKYDFVDHRKEADYQNWQEQYKQWEIIKKDEQIHTGDIRTGFFYEAELSEYLGYLQSGYYSCCIFVKEKSKIWSDDLLLKQLKKIGANIENKKNQDYFLLNDHASNIVLEASGAEKVNYALSFGKIKYDNSEDRAKLFIGGQKNNYLKENSGGLHIILVEKASGDIVDDVSFDYDNKENKWIKIGEKNMGDK